MPRIGVDHYPSRIYDEPQVIERQDPVVYGSLAHVREHGPIGGWFRPHHHEAFERDGFLVVPSLFYEHEIADFQRELDRMRNDPAIREREETVLEPESREVRSIFAIHKLNRLFARLCRDPRLLHVLRHLLASDVYIHQSRINYKPGLRGREFYWHSDFETWHVEDGLPRMRTISASITLTENTATNGPLMLMPGSQRQFVSCVGETPEDNYKSSLRRQIVGTPDDATLTEMYRRYGVKQAAGPAGTLILFDCNTMHGSNSNITPLPRSNVFFVYNSVENAPEAPFSGLAPRPEYIGAQEVEPLDDAPRSNRTR